MGESVLLKWGFMGTVQKQDLISQVVASGCDPPSDDLLKRLAREGLLQRPKQRHPGRQRGSVSDYPAKAVAQAIGVLRLHSEVHRFDNLRFWAFWEGMWVESRILRRTLSNWMKSVLPSLPRDVDPYVLAEDLAFSYPGDQLAKRLPFKRTEDSQSAMFAIIYGAMGGDPGWDYQSPQETTRESLDQFEPPDLAERLLKFDQLTQPIGSFGRFVDEAPHPSEPLQLMADTGLGNPGWWNRAIREVPIAELKAARDTARILSEDFVDIARFTSEADLGTFPRLLIRGLRGPNGRGAAAIRHRVKMIGFGMVVNRMHQQEVSENLDAMRDAAQTMRATSVIKT